ncbi:MAG: thioredoxin domain-containing protein [Oscillospiraceae bacterium]|nr:thioredoxin domain-containing protein [Oscillospiraceae bacterium]
MENRLKQSASPYLRSHADNPIPWHEWGPAAFAEARERDVPIFLSVGYSSCHWCHVMNRESFMDESVAHMIAANFVAIKLDREERPDIDHLYMEACTAITGQGGWPLTVFLGHDKSPFFAGTYYPKETLLGLLARVRDMWRDNRAQLTGAGRELLSFLSRPVSGGDVGRGACVATGASALESIFDDSYGGFHPAPKFPALQRLLFLLRHAHVAENPGRSSEIVSKTLDGMAAGGIYDHVGGGFFRYSTDRLWHIPHYEKMLYDNAMAILTYAEAAVASDQPHFAEIARATVEFTRREFGASAGGFYTALDAENEAGEGAFYLWTRSQVEEVLGPERAGPFCEAFHIDDTPSLPHRIGEGADEARANAVRPYGEELTQLYEHRRGARDLPFRDEKILTSSNALLAAALASAGRLLGEQGWIEEAEGICRFILEHLALNGRLYASYFDDAARQKAVLDDYAYFVWALLELYQSTFDPKWLGLALNWNAHMTELFGGSGGGFFLSGRDVTDLPLRQKVYLDGPVPSGNAVACANLLRLHALTKDESYLSMAEGILSGALGAMNRYPTSATGLLSAILLLGNVSTLTISPGLDQSTLIEAAQGYFPFLQMAVVGEAGGPQPQMDRLVPTAETVAPIDGNAAAYFCDRSGCHRPITSERVLREVLRG